MSNTQIASIEDAFAEHHVRFYKSDNFIHKAVAEFFAGGLSAGQPLVLVSTPEHRDGIFDALSSLGCSGLQAASSGQIRWVDARETLALFMVNGMPDDQLFRTYIGRIFEQTRAGREHLTIRRFGEMVDLLLCDGNPEAAL